MEGLGSEDVVKVEGAAAAAAAAGGHGLPQPEDKAAKDIKAAASTPGQESDDGEPLAKGQLSPLSGSYLLIVIAEPHTAEDRERIIKRLTRGLLAWDMNHSHVDLNCELLNLSNTAPDGDEGKNGEKLVQWASENLVVEVLIHSQVNTLLQCMKNLLSSFTRHRHIIHAGYTFQGTGSWILQDGTFSSTDFLDLWSEPEVVRLLTAYKGDVSVVLQCAAENGWTEERMRKEPFSKLCQLSVNSPDVLSQVHNAGITSFIEYLSKFVVTSPLTEMLESSDIVGNIRFSHPTLYVFPGGQGDAALFGVNGFNMLIDGGFARKACFWDFTRHLDRLDAVLLTRVNNNTIGGLGAILDRKSSAQVFPQIGHFFGNIIEGDNKKEDGEKDSEKEIGAKSDDLIVSLTEQGRRMVENLRSMSLRPQLCYRDSTLDPVNLYHKVGHGKLDLYILNPARDSRELKEFLSKWTSNAAATAKFPTRGDPTRDFTYPVLNLVSICALLVWQPANPKDRITRILFPGSTPQHKIFEALGKLKHLEFLRYPVCTAESLAAHHKSKLKSESLVSEAKYAMSSALGSNRASGTNVSSGIQKSASSATSSKAAKSTINKKEKEVEKQQTNGKSEVTNGVATKVSAETNGTPAKKSKAAEQQQTNGNGTGTPEIIERKPRAATRGRKTEKSVERSAAAVTNGSGQPEIIGEKEKLVEKKERISRRPEKKYTAASAKKPEKEKDNKDVEMGNGKESPIVVATAKTTSKIFKKSAAPAAATTTTTDGVITKTPSSTRVPSRGRPPKAASAKPGLTAPDNGSSRGHSPAREKEIKSSSAISTSAAPPAKPQASSKYGISKSLSKSTTAAADKEKPTTTATTAPAKSTKEAVNRSSKILSEKEKDAEKPKPMRQSLMSKSTIGGTDNEKSKAGEATKQPEKKIPVKAATQPKGIPRPSTAKPPAAAATAEKPSGKTQAQTSAPPGIKAVRRTSAATTAAAAGAAGLVIVGAGAAAAAAATASEDKDSAITNGESATATSPESKNEESEAVAKTETENGTKPEETEEKTPEVVEIETSAPEEEIPEKLPEIDKVTESGSELSSLEPEGSVSSISAGDRASHEDADADEGEGEAPGGTPSSTRTVHNDNETPLGAKLLDSLEDPDNIDNENEEDEYLVVEKSFEEDEGDKNEKLLRPGSTPAPEDELSSSGKHTPENVNLKLIESPASGAKAKSDELQIDSSSPSPAPATEATDDKTENQIGLEEKSKGEIKMEIESSVSEIGKKTPEKDDFTSTATELISSSAADEQEITRSGSQSTGFASSAEEGSEPGSLTIITEKEKPLISGSAMTTSAYDIDIASTEKVSDEEAEDEEHETARKEMRSDSCSSTTIAGGQDRRGSQRISDSMSSPEAEAEAEFTANATAAVELIAVEAELAVDDKKSSGGQPEEKGKEESQEAENKDKVQPIESQVSENSELAQSDLLFGTKRESPEIISGKNEKIEKLSETIGKSKSKSPEESETEEEEETEKDQYTGVGSSSLSKTVEKEKELSPRISPTKAQDENSTAEPEISKEFEKISPMPGLESSEAKQVSPSGTESGNRMQVQVESETLQEPEEIMTPIKSQETYSSVFSATTTVDITQDLGADERKMSLTAKAIEEEIEEKPDKLKLSAEEGKFSSGKSDKGSDSESEHEDDLPTQFTISHAKVEVLPTSVVSEKLPISTQAVDKEYLSSDESEEKEDSKPEKADKEDSKFDKGDISPAKSDTLVEKTKEVEISPAKSSETIEKHEKSDKGDLSPAKNDEWLFSPVKESSPLVKSEAEVSPGKTEPEVAPTQKSDNDFQPRKLSTIEDSPVKSDKESEKAEPEPDHSDKESDVGFETSSKTTEVAEISDEELTTPPARKADPGFAFEKIPQLDEPLTKKVEKLEELSTKDLSPILTSTEILKPEAEIESKDKTDEKLDTSLELTSTAQKSDDYSTMSIKSEKLETVDSSPKSEKPKTPVDDSVAVAAHISGEFEEMSDYYVDMEKSDLKPEKSDKTPNEHEQKRSSIASVGKLSLSGESEDEHETHEEKSAVAAVAPLSSEKISSTEKFPVLGKLDPTADDDEKSEPSAKAHAEFILKEVDAELGEKDSIEDFTPASSQIKSPSSPSPSLTKTEAVSSNLNELESFVVMKKEIQSSNESVDKIEQAAGTGVDSFNIPAENWSKQEPKAGAEEITSAATGDLESKTFSSKESDDEGEKSDERKVGSEPESMAISTSVTAQPRSSDLSPKELQRSSPYEMEKEKEQAKDEAAFLVESLEKEIGASASAPAPAFTPVDSKEKEKEVEPEITSTTSKFIEKESKEAFDTTTDLKLKDSPQDFEFKASSSKSDNFETSSKVETFEISSQQDKFETLSKPDKIEMSSQPEKFEPSSKLDDFESSSKAKKFETPSNTEKFEISSKLETFESSPQPEKFETPSKTEEFETSAKLDDFESSSKMKKFESPSNTEKFETSSKVETFESSPQQEKFETPLKTEEFETSLKPDDSESSSKTEKFETPLNKETFESSSKLETFEISPKQEKFETPSKVETFESSSKPDDSVKDIDTLDKECPKPPSDFGKSSPLDVSSALTKDTELQFGATSQIQSQEKESTIEIQSKENKPDEKIEKQLPPPTLYDTSAEIKVDEKPAVTAPASTSPSASRPIPIPSAIPPHFPRETRQAIRTPDEVAELPMHEEVEPGTYEVDGHTVERYLESDEEEEVSHDDLSDEGAGEHAATPTGGEIQKSPAARETSPDVKDQKQSPVDTKATATTVTTNLTDPILTTTVENNEKLVPSPNESSDQTEESSSRQTEVEAEGIIGRSVIVSSSNKDDKIDSDTPKATTSSTSMNTSTIYFPGSEPISGTSVVITPSTPPVRPDLDLGTQTEAKSSRFPMPPAESNSDPKKEQEPKLSSDSNKRDSVEEIKFEKVTVTSTSGSAQVAITEKDDQAKNRTVFYVGDDQDHDEHDEDEETEPEPEPELHFHEHQDDFHDEKGRDSEDGEIYEAAMMPPAFGAIRSGLLSAATTVSASVIRISPEEYAEGRTPSPPQAEEPVFEKSAAAVSPPAVPAETANQKNDESIIQSAGATADKSKSVLDEQDTQGGNLSVNSNNETQVKCPESGPTPNPFVSENEEEQEKSAAELGSSQLGHRQEGNDYDDGHSEPEPESETGRDNYINNKNPFTTTAAAEVGPDSNSQNENKNQVPATGTSTSTEKKSIQDASAEEETETRKIYETQPTLSAEAKTQEIPQVSSQSEKSIIQSGDNKTKAKAEGELEYSVKSPALGLGSMSTSAMRDDLQDFTSDILTEAETRSSSSGLEFSQVKPDENNQQEQEKFQLQSGTVMSEPDHDEIFEVISGSHSPGHQEQYFSGEEEENEENDGVPTTVTKTTLTAMRRYTSEDYPQSSPPRYAAGAGHDDPTARGELHRRFSEAGATFSNTGAGFSSSGPWLSSEMEFHPDSKTKVMVTTTTRVFPEGPDSEPQETTKTRHFEIDSGQHSSNFEPSGQEFQTFLLESSGEAEGDEAAVAASIARQFLASAGDKNAAEFQTTTKTTTTFTTQIITGSSSSQQQQQQHEVADDETYSSGEFSDSQLSTVPQNITETDDELSQPLEHKARAALATGDLRPKSHPMDFMLEPEVQDLENGNAVTTTTTSTKTFLDNDGQTKSCMTTTTITTRQLQSSSTSSHVEEESSTATGMKAEEADELLKKWGKPLGLPAIHPEGANGHGPPSDVASAASSDVAGASASGSAQAPPSAGGTPTPKKQRSSGPNTPGKIGVTHVRKTPMAHHRSKNLNPIYLDLAYVPHHGNSNYCDSEFFRLLRARYYVFSGLEPSRKVFDGLLEGKQAWDDKNLDVTIIPTYDTDSLGYWVTDSEAALTEARIDLAPSASRCTINLQDHETCCSAYRLEF